MYNKSSATTLPSRLRLLSFNVQAGVGTERYRDYVTKSWRHVLPDKRSMENLKQIGHFLRQFDIVALQEVDGGSIRSQFVNQVEYLAKCGNFPYWYQQLNRNLGKFAQHSNGLLSHHRPITIHEHKLPGIIPGRGAILVKLGNETNPLVLILMHLALGRRARDQQIHYVAELAAQHEHVVLMGDMNCPGEMLLKSPYLKDSKLRLAHDATKTFPSWSPQKDLDHFLVSPSVHIEQAHVYPANFSDHLPIAIDIRLGD
ncbi:MAG: endonuclease [Legionellales bacterium]|nr:endonuclease [Legionellales bacterium]|tara:strand:- start:127526 stop:128296 length:771 start_codon:yes stop_codon:yes gene_type:complete